MISHQAVHMVVGIIICWFLQLLGSTNLLLFESFCVATAACAEGYTRTTADGACRTPFGCAFPQIELQILPGIPGSMITMSCVDRCEFPAFSTGPGMCTVALP